LSNPPPYDHENEPSLPQGCQAGPNKLKAKFGHKEFQKGQIIKNEKEQKEVKFYSQIL